MNRRRTIQRDLVLTAVRNSMTHPTADEVFASVVADYPSISKATVYRNLNLLVETGDIRRVPIPGNWPDHFDRTLSPHYHVYCERCGKVSDVDLPYQQELAGLIVDSDGFEVYEHEIVFHGLCPDCQSKNHCRRDPAEEKKNGIERIKDRS